MTFPVELKETAATKPRPKRLAFQSRHHAESGFGSRNVQQPRMIYNAGFATTGTGIMAVTTFGSVSHTEATQAPQSAAK